MSEQEKQDNKPPTLDESLAELNKKKAAEDLAALVNEIPESAAYALVVHTKQGIKCNFAGSIEPVSACALVLNSYINRKFIP